MMKVYLSGGIFPNDLAATNDWRVHATQYLEGTGHTVINPCRGKATYRYGYHTPNEIVFRDLQDIDSCDLLLTNFINIPNKLFTGTQMEIMHAWMNGVPTVVVTKDPRLTQHPWVQAMSVRIFPELDEALDYVVTFWS